MNPDLSNAQEMDAAVFMSFQLSGRHVDQEVAKGRHLDDVLAEQHRKPGGDYWHDPARLRPFSTAVAGE